MACWSGLGYFIWQSLARRGIEVELIGQLSLPSAIRKAMAVKQLFHAKVARDVYLPEHDVMASKAYGRQVWQRLQGLRHIEAVVSPGAIPVAYLPGNMPLVTVSDATHRLLFASYPAYKDLSAASRRHGDRIERAAIKRASASVFASEWAAASAIRDYSAEPARVHVVPFGANFEHQPAREDVVRAIDARASDKIQLLFIGVEWERKGGPVALQVLRTLVKQGVPAHLTVVGCEPAISHEDASHVSVRGFIEKTTAGQEEIHGLLGKSHFLIVPSEAECYGLVYCEASALGVPSIARKVGGVSTIITNNGNGRLFELQDNAAHIARWIVETTGSPATYRRLALASLAEYESRLNWVVAGEKLERILRRAIGNARQRNAY